MVRTLLTIFYRTIKKNSTQYLPNILGLIVAFVSIFLIAFTISYQTSFDTFHDNADLIYRVNYDETVSGNPGARYLPTTGPPLAKAMMEQFPEVKYGTRIRHYKNRMLSVGESSFFEDNLYYVDPEFMKMFSFRLIKGNSENCLELPNSIVLTKEMANKYFGSEDPLGKSLVVDQTEEFIVTGILENVPANSTLDFDFLLPFQAFKVPYGYPVDLETWGWISFYNFIQLNDRAGLSDLESKLPSFAAAHFDEERANRMAYRLQPLQEIYLGKVNNGDVKQGNQQYINLLFGVGIIILIISGFNFVNLSIVVGTNRSSEIALKKVFGGRTKGVIIHTLIENMLLSLGSFTVSACIIYINVNQFSYIADIPVAFINTSFLSVFIGLLLVALIFSLLSGIYPAIISSHFNINQVIRGELKSGPRAGLLRRSLLGFQFAAVTLLMMTSLAVYKQMQFIQQKNLGYKPESILILKGEREGLRSLYNSLDQTLAEVPGVVNSSLSGEMLDGDQGSVPFVTNDKEQLESFPIDLYGVRAGWFETMGLDMLAGRTFRKEYEADSLEGVILNEQALNIIGWSPDEAIGRHARVGDIIDGKVIGIVKDFHYSSLHNNIGPLAILVPRALVDKVVIQYEAADQQIFLANLQAKWKEIAPAQVFDPMFLDERINHLYQKEKSFSNLIFVFCLIAVFISCIGLYGIIEYHIFRKLREMGIRKLLGANEMRLFFKITGSFFLIVFIAGIIVIPFGNLLISTWLQNFAYSVSISYSQYLLVFGSVLFLSLLILGGAYFKSARAKVTGMLQT